MIIRFARTGSRWLFRGLLWLVLVVTSVALMAALLFQFWFLPRADDYRDEIAVLVREATGVNIQIGSLMGQWRSWRPHVTLGQVLVRDAQGRDALIIDSIRSEIAWKSLALLEMRLHSLDVSRLSLEVRRDARGALFVAGLPLHAGDASHAGLGDWLLRQDSVTLNESRVRWIDEMSAAPALELAGVLVEVRNRFGLHRVRLQGTPPASLGAPFRIDAEMRGERLSNPADWDGFLELTMPYVNLAEVRRFLPRMQQIDQGAGSVEARFEFDHGAVRHVNAKLALAGLRGTLAPELEPLQLTRVSGVLDVERGLGSLRANLKDISFVTPDGLSQAGVSGRFEREVGEGGVLESDLDFNAIDLQPVVSVAGKLPLSEALRLRLLTMQPRGRVTQLKLSTREQAGKLVKYRLSAGFDALAMRPWGQFPGFSGMSGTVKADERGGDLTLTGRNGQLDVPRVFANALPIDQIDARFNWRMQADAIDVRIAQFEVANRDAAGRLEGSYRYVRGAAGRADLKASLSRGDATAVWRYMPLVVPASVHRWLRQALLAGRSRQADLVLRGDLDQFPFSRGRPGTFEVTVQAEAGVVDYVPGWPRLEDVACRLVIRANRLEISQATARIYGAALRNATVVVPDLGATEPTVQVRGEAQGRASDFLRYVSESPLSNLAGGAAREFRVQGDGQLALSLEIPVLHPHTTKADGAFSLNGNRLTLPWELGQVDQLAGVLRISHQGLSARGLSAVYLGGPVRFDLQPMSPGGAEVVASGRAGGAGIAQLLRLGLDRHLSGVAQWSGRFGIHADRVDAQVESDLAGLASTLPAPLGKAAGERLNLRVERSRHESGMGMLRAQLGDRVLVRYLSPSERWFDARTGEIVFNAPSGESERDGLRVSGRLPELDLDAWGAVLRERRGAGVAGGAGRDLPHPPLTLRALQVEKLRWFGRDFGSVTVSGRHTDAATQVSVEGRAALGDLSWHGQGSGQLTARMARLYLPPAQGNLAAVTEPSAAEALPAIEAEVQDFRLGEREFGRLELSAVPQGRVWDLRKLDLSAPEGSTRLRGQYDLRGRVPRTKVEVHVDVSDIGGYFARLHLPQGIRRGKARLHGNLEWSGAPYTLDLPSMMGRVALEATQGQFTRIDPGVGKLLGVLSLQSLPRRLTLDFRDVFSQGFAFTQINATSDISGGVATTQDFRMVGPSAAVEIKGGADLLRETQNLRVRVIPGVGDNLTVAGALFNPAIGLAAYLAQKVFNDPLNKLFSVEYDVTGGWADPQVSKRTVEPPVSKGRR